MRWDALFEDLEAQLAAEEAAELAAEVAERVRAEVGAVSLSDRLRAHVGSVVVVRTSTAGVVRGTLDGVGSDVVLLVDEVGRRVLVPLGAMSAVSGLGRPAHPPSSPLTGRIGLRHALRELARARHRVRVDTPSGSVAGLVQRVAADHVDIAPRPTDDLHPGGDGGTPEAVPLTAIVSVWSA